MSNPQDLAQKSSLLGPNLPITEPSLFEAFSLQPDGKAKAVQFTRASHKAQNSGLNEALALCIKTKAAAEARLEQLAHDLPLLREAVLSGAPYYPYDSDEPRLPDSWVSRCGVIVAFTGICILEVSTCANIFAFALPVVQSAIAAASMAAPIAASPFTVKLFTGTPSPARISVGIAALLAISGYAWLFARSIGQAGGLEMSDTLGAQLIAETLAMAAMSLGISRMLQPKATQRTKEAFVHIQQEQVELTSNLQVANAQIEAAAAGENAAALKAEALVTALQEAENEQRTFLAGRSRRIRDIAGSFFTSAKSN